MVIWLSVAAGCMIIALVIVDIVLTLFTPSMRGRMNIMLVGAVWRLSRPFARRSSLARELAGPLTFLSVVTLWALMIGLGWALIYWPFLRSDFLVNFGLDLNRTSANNFLASLYLSFVVLATLGFGDIVPISGILRFVVVLEAFVGFGLLTAGISWFLSTSPALSRRRVLAQQIALIHSAAHDAHPLRDWDDETMAQTLRDIALELAAVQSDLEQYPVIYYFRNADPDADLVLKLPFLLQLARGTQATEDAAQVPVELRSAMLERAVVDLLATIGRQYLNITENDPDALLKASIADHAVLRRRRSQRGK